jgi:ferric-dicitrate binding protein FerR (iron transport regulator)
MLEPSLGGADIDWNKVDAKLFARVNAEAKSHGALGRFAGTRAWAAAAAALALAAAIPMMLGRSSTTPLEDAIQAESRADRSAGALAWKEGTGDVRIAGAQASAGSALERDDAVETRGARAVFERAPHGKTAVTWTLEDASRITVRGTRGPLVLALEHGAVEAQVTPVASGEAFAVDVEGARVAVHGTHLRVARDGTHVVVDLTEGVVSIGAPPRVGSTYGELVNAPAHIEFDANDPHGTLKVTHAADRVRAAFALRPPPEASVTVTPRAQIPPEATHAPSPVAFGTRAPITAPKNDAPAPSSAVPAPPAAPQATADVAIDLHPEQTIADAVRQCARIQPAGDPDNVVITVSSRLELQVGADGAVTLAKFDPPLNPEVQSCASTTIYRTHFAQAGTVTIPLDFKR